jgi:hypothetical protein
MTYTAGRTLTRNQRRPIPAREKVCRRSADPTGSGSQTSATFWPGPARPAGDLIILRHRSGLVGRQPLLVSPRIDSILRLTLRIAF